MAEIDDHSFMAAIYTRFNETPFEILKTPNIEPRQIMMRAVNGEKPFGGKNDGYKDYLLWMTVLEEAKKFKKDLPIYFISENVRDFAEDSKVNFPQLHHRLIGDLLFTGLPEDSVKFYRSTNEFRVDRIDPQMQSMAELATQIQGQTFANTAFYIEIPNAIEQWFNSRYTPEILNFLQAPSTIKWVDTLQMSRLKNLQHARARSYPGGQIMVEVLATVDCDLVAEVEPNTEVGRYFTEGGQSLTPHGFAKGVYRRELRFIISALLDPKADNRIMRMDATLLTPPYEEIEEAGWSAHST